MWCVIGSHGYHGSLKLLWVWEGLAVNAWCDQRTVGHALENLHVDGLVQDWVNLIEVSTVLR